MTRAVPLADTPRACPSPCGRRWPEGPDEGSFGPSPGASRHPLPEGEGLAPRRSLKTKIVVSHVSPGFPGSWISQLGQEWSMTAHVFGVCCTTASMATSPIWRFVGNVVRQRQRDYRPRKRNPLLCQGGECSHPKRSRQMSKFQGAVCDRPNSLISGKTVAHRATLQFGHA
jgi:hypothetical protein